MFEFKLSFSSFRLCRPKKKIPPTHYFSPFNPKVLEIAYPITPSPPPTTPNFQQPQLSISKTDNVKKTTKKKLEDEKAISSRSSEESGWFSISSSSSDGETEESVDSSKKKDNIGGGGGRLLMRESLTVVKWSEKPYEDFKKSMLEMILEKEMVEAKDLEHLLQCFLSLNSKHHHADIVAAFTAIWELLFL